MDVVFPKPMQMWFFKKCTTIPCANGQQTTTSSPLFLKLLTNLGKDLQIRTNPKSTGVCFMKIGIQKWHLPIHLDISVKTHNATHTVYLPYETILIVVFRISLLLHAPNLDKKRRMSNQSLSKTEIFLITNRNLPQFPLGKNSPLRLCLPNLKSCQMSTPIPFSSSSNR